MKAVNGKILVRCDMEQKELAMIGGVEMRIARQYDNNFRERSPVVAIAEEDSDKVGKGDVLLCHHNTFYGHSPYLVEGDLFSIPSNGNIIFAKVLQDGTLLPLYGNLLIERLPIPSDLPVPPELQDYYLNKFRVVDGGYTRYQKGWTVFGQNHSFYEIVFHWGREEKRIFKTHEDKLVGYKKEF